MRLLFVLPLGGCQSSPDLPQMLAGADAIAVWQAGKDSLRIEQKFYIREVANHLAYVNEAPARAQYQMAFLRKSFRYVLLAGTLDAEMRQFSFLHRGKYYVCKVGTPARVVLQQARKYPSLLLTYQHSRRKKVQTF